MSELNNMQIVAEEFKKIPVGYGSRFSTNFNTLLNRHIKNERPLNGEKSIISPATLTNMYDMLCGFVSGKHKEMAETRWSKRDMTKFGGETPKFYCSIIFFMYDGNRHTLHEITDTKTYNLKTTGACYFYWSGGCGIDIDIHGIDVFTPEQKELIIVKLKELIYNKLQKFKWFGFTTRSTGGGGIHVWNFIDPKSVIYSTDDWKYIENFFRCFYNVCIYNICSCVYELKDYFDWLDDDMIQRGIILDDAMKKLSQGMNLSVTDIEPYVNPNFRYERFKKLEEWNTYNPNNEWIPITNENNNVLYKVYKENCKKNEKANQANIDDAVEYKPAAYETKTKTTGDRPFHLRHDDIKNDPIGFVGQKMLSTLGFIYTDEEILDILNNPVLYEDHSGSAKKDWEGWVRRGMHRRQLPGGGERRPNFGYINRLNKEFGWNIKINTKYEPAADKHKTIELKDNEFLGTDKEGFFSYIKPGINIVQAGTGTGKTELWKSVARDIDEMNNNPLNDKRLNVIITEPYNSVISSKFGELGDKCEIVTGSKRIHIDSTRSNFICTNYDHINMCGPDLFDMIDYFVIDESHLICSEMFRGDTLSKTIKQINEAGKRCKVVLMTGTPAAEEKLFNVTNKVVYNKPIKAKIDYEWKQFKAKSHDDPKLDLSHISCLARTLVQHKYKVFVYDQDMSLNSCKKFKHINPDLKTCIYHKRHLLEKDNEDVKYIDSEHKLGDKFDVIISSCFFGVGNDLDDEGKAACIIIGNHTWQEDIQVIGRWRKAKKIQVFCILKDIHKDWYNNWYPVSYDVMKNNEKKIAEYILSDSMTKENSLTVNSKAFPIKTIDDIDIYAGMKIHDTVNSRIMYKYAMFKKYSINAVAEEFDPLPLTWSDKDVESSREFSKVMSEIRDSNCRIILNNLVNNKETEDLWNIVNTDTKLEKWYKAIHALWKYNNKLFIDNIKFCSKRSNWESINMFNTYSVMNSVNKKKNMEEILSWIWMDRESVNIKSPFETVDDYHYCLTCAYLVFWSYITESNAKDNIKYDYFNEWQNKYELWTKLPEDMKEIICYNFDDVDLPKEYTLFGTNFIFEDGKILFNGGEKGKEVFEKIIKRMEGKVRLVNPKVSENRAKKGGKTGRAFKKLRWKGKIYGSREKLAKAANKDVRTITRWISNGNVEVVEDDACN